MDQVLDTMEKMEANVMELISVVENLRAEIAGLKKVPVKKKVVKK